MGTENTEASTVEGRNPKEAASNVENGKKGSFETLLEKYLLLFVLGIASLLVCLWGERPWLALSLVIVGLTVWGIAQLLRKYRWVGVSMGIVVLALLACGVVCLLARTPEVLRANTQIYFEGKGASLVPDPTNREDWTTSREVLITRYEQEPGDVIKLARNRSDDRWKPTTPLFVEDLSEQSEKLEKMEKAILPQKAFISHLQTKRALQKAREKEYRNDVEVQIELTQAQEEGNRSEHELAIRLEALAGMDHSASLRLLKTENISPSETRKSQKALLDRKIAQERLRATGNTKRFEQRMLVQGLAKASELEVIDTGIEHEQAKEDFVQYQIDVLKKNLEKPAIPLYAEKGTNGNGSSDHSTEQLLTDAMKPSGQYEESLWSIQFAFAHPGGNSFTSPFLRNLYPPGNGGGNGIYHPKSNVPSLPSLEVREAVVTKLARFYQDDRRVRKGEILLEVSLDTKTRWIRVEAPREKWSAVKVGNPVNWVPDADVSTPKEGLVGEVKRIRKNPDNPDTFFVEAIVTEKFPGSPKAPEDYAFSTRGRWKIYVRQTNYGEKYTGLSGETKGARAKLSSALEALKSFFREKTGDNFTLPEKEVRQ